MRTVILGALAGLMLAGPAVADVLSEIAERGSIRLGVRADAAPFSYRDEKGRASGLAVALCSEVTRRIALQVGQPEMKTDFVTVTAAERFPALLEGRTDLHCGPASATLKRRETLDFSILYFVDGATAAVRPGTYESVFDARLGKVGVLAGTTTVDVVSDLLARNGVDAEVVTFTSHVRGLDALANNKLDLYFGDQAILLFQIASQGLSDYLAVMDEHYSFEPYALVMRRDESDLRLAVDRALSEIYADGTIYRLIQSALGDFPLSDEARAVYQIVGMPE